MGHKCNLLVPLPNHRLETDAFGAAQSEALASAGDVLTTLTIIKQVPKRSVLFNSGMKTYWKPVANMAIQGTS